MVEMVAAQIERVLPEVIAFRRDLHAHPELSGKEYDASRKVRRVLSKLPGMEVLPPLMETDVVAVLNADREGPCIALRADLDALPIPEETEVPYKSTVPGVMHACGHDGHTAVLVAAAMVLSQLADSLPGKVKFIFQPDEEDGGGGGVLCQRGVLASPTVDAIVALHAWPAQPVGTIAIRSGPATAANNSVTITIRGRGGHGAYPHQSTDPIVAAAHVITALQTIVSRTIDPLHAGVVTIGHISAGAAGNVIPSECRMTGTIRYHQTETGEQLRRSVRRVADHAARAHGAEADVRIDGGYPPVINDAKLTGLVESVARDLLGPEHVATEEPPGMGVEDFGFYAQRVPAAIFRLGVRPENTDSYPTLHHPQFDFNDAALPIGTRMLCEVTRRFFLQAER